MDFFQAILLTAIQKLNGERSLFAIYHMLQGKKSSQTIQDAHLFGLTGLFGTQPSVTRDMLERTSLLFLKKEWIKHTRRPDIFVVTNEGTEKLENYLSVHPIPEGLDGWRYQASAALFWSRLNLLIQTVSHIVYSQPKFYPIQRDAKIQRFVKSFLHIHRQDRENLGQDIFMELSKLLEQQPALQRDIFVMKLTGYRQVGLTTEQIAEIKQMDRWNIHYLFLASLHMMIRSLEEMKGEDVLLGSLLEQVQEEKESFLTQSTKTTLKYLMAGRSIREIAEIRRLKTSTIEDHVVEIVLIDRTFPIAEYISPELQDEIERVIKATGSKQLKRIRGQLEKEVSFFQIRLVLAKVR
ncbi:helix-turn-helix domain-containing protein [Bacillus massiliglaciei]|uniref:helix-turn-helix domain-containing protein n=1 Tax=Bacillus massiliglaciei TaxID=1816693 RepID=UPI000A3DA44F|nr:helix-turn-helix domain-containing protein [Bacillus massiliglaciei]